MHPEDLSVAGSKRTEAEDSWRHLDTHVVRRTTTTSKDVCSLNWFLFARDTCPSKAKTAVDIQFSVLYSSIYIAPLNSREPTEALFVRLAQVLFLGVFRGVA